MSLAIFFTYLASIVCAAIVGIGRFKYLSIPFRFLVALLITTAVSESFTTYLSFVLHVNNRPVYHFYLIIAFWLYCFIYFHLVNNARSRLLILLMAICFTIFSVIDSLFFQKIQDFPSNNLIVCNVMLVALSLLYFKYLIDINPFEALKKNSRYLLNTGILIYFTLEIFIWGILDYLEKVNKYNGPVIIFGLLLSILYYSFLSIIILRVKETPVLKK
jgi:hypothetical protein